MRPDPSFRPPRLTLRPSRLPKATKPTLLSGGNPQIAKADGDAPVQTYISAMPGWKREIGQRLDALIVGNVPGVHKAVRWNSPLYGIKGQSWFVGFHVFAKYVKVTFDLDEARLSQWIRQAAALPGWGRSSA